MFHDEQFEEPWLQIAINAKGVARISTKEAEPVGF